MARVMLDAANGTIGRFMVQIQRAAELAIKAGKLRIDENLTRRAQRSVGPDLGGTGADT